MCSKNGSYRVTRSQVRQNVGDIDSRFDGLQSLADTMYLYFGTLSLNLMLASPNRHRYPHLTDIHGGQRQSVMGEMRQTS